MLYFPVALGLRAVSHIKYKSGVFHQKNMKLEIRMWTLYLREKVHFYEAATCEIITALARGQGVSRSGLRPENMEIGRHGEPGSSWQGQWCP